jgi:cell division protein FtsI (penicillin-binding protein 3)
MTKKKAKKNNKSRRDWIRFRFFMLLVAMFVGVGAVLAQSYRIQIQHGEGLREEARQIYHHQVTLLPARGSIFDRNGEDLAISIPVESVYARPHNITDPGETARRLAPFLERKSAEIAAELRKDRRFVWLERQVVPPVSARIQELNLAGIGVIQESRRFYPNLELACHLLGIVGVDGHGLEGLELQYDKRLYGEERRIMIDRDARGQRLAPPEGLLMVRNDGHHLILTIHRQIQHVAEQYIEEAVADTGSKSGSAVVIAPKTGEILAMANVPRFNPNTFSRYSGTTFRNRCITDVYEPGSTFKPIIISAALEAQVLDSSDIVYCENGSFRVFDRIIHDVKGHGWLTPKGILQYSSNIGAAKVGISLGAERLHRYIKAFGFGEPTGIDLPGESTGSVRPQNQWSPVDLATISFGQGISATALQMAAAFAALANDGRRMQPYVVREILDAKGHTVERRKPKDLGPAVSPATAHEVTRMLTAVVSEKGTGAKAAIEGFTVAGKTGTSQKPDLRSGGYLRNRYLASFVGFVPAYDPRMCIVVVLDEPKGTFYGSQVAAPVFQRIAQDALGILDVFPEERLLARAPRP